ncbi:hypothetical protein [Cyanobium sp. ATX-6F1]|uniref:hypothetical protein n=1 Tax=Cyanobium sp. ATX-6F1 TaxID=3137388 RepID=UPI0039BE0229
MGLAGAWWGADHLASGLYELWRPRIERPVSRAMGHPLVLGPYEGLRPWGFEVGPSRFLPGPKDGSSVLVQRLIVRLMPLESLRQGVPVLALRLEGASAQMRRNARGQYWVLGPQEPTGSPRDWPCRSPWLSPPACASSPPVCPRAWRLGWISTCIGAASS